MKLALAGLAGATVSAAGVVAAGHLPALLVILGFVLGAGWMWTVVTGGTRTPAADVSSILNTASIDLSSMFDTRAARSTAAVALSDVQRDVRAALFNLKANHAAVEQAVRESYQSGDSFESLFRKAVKAL